jgi:fructuronate reductase
MVVPLSTLSIPSLSEKAIRPPYDRSRLRTGIVHLGLGAFHRAHQALYTEALLERGDTRWGIAGVHLRGAEMAETLARQDHLYSVTERHGDAVQTRIVGALRAALYAPHCLSRVLELMADPNVTIVSTTVTEKGYCRDPATGELDQGDPGIRHDLLHPDTPQTTLGVLAAGIRRRPSGAPLTLVCCDNMSANGDTVRRLLVQYTESFDRDLARRISKDIAFPNSMVDRIVPAASADSLAWVEARLGVRDEAAIVCEPFTQWVLEDRFAGSRPAWEDSGAMLTTEVGPFEAMKLRLLNGTHSAIAYLGQLRGRQTVSEAMSDPALAAFVRGLMTDDLRATVEVPPGYDVHAYCRDLIRRFENPTLAHRTQQIAMDGTQKIPVRWLPALRESAAAGIERPYLERALVAWLHYLVSEHNESGAALVISDPGAAALAARVRAARDADTAVRAALAHASVFGAMPWPSAFADRLGRHLSALRQGGSNALLAWTDI